MWTIWTVYTVENYGCSFRGRRYTLSWTTSYLSVNIAVRWESVVHMRRKHGREAEEKQKWNEKQERTLVWSIHNTREAVIYPMHLNEKTVSTGLIGNQETVTHQFHITATPKLHSIRCNIKHSSVKPSTRVSMFCKHLRSRHILCVQWFNRNTSVMPQGETTQTTVVLLTVIIQVLLTWKTHWVLVLTSWWSMMALSVLYVIVAPFWCFDPLAKQIINIVLIKLRLKGLTEAIRM